ncbi:MAG TPA: hypothetical protein VK776_23955 [Bryobacteraceae bacterium]|jgi:hypothetical protein|nr:hypothetical protein [Bryobacteraceae bacterium]
MASLSALGFVLRVFAYLFELVLSFFLIGLGIVAWVSGSNSLSFGMQFWEGVTLKWIILIAGIVGLASLLLAGSRLRWIFPVWSFLVLVMMVRGFFLSSYSFAGANQFQFAVWLTAGALLAFLGSLGVLRRRMSRR